MGKFHSVLKKKKLPIPLPPWCLSNMSKPFKLSSLSRERSEQGGLPLPAHPPGLQRTFSHKVSPNAAEIASIMEYKPG